MDNKYKAKFLQTYTLALLFPGQVKGLYTKAFNALINAE